jgi:hypothetical protein
MNYQYYNQNASNSWAYKRIRNLAKLKYKSRIERLEYLPSGFTKDQTCGALMKAWVAFMISKDNYDQEKKEYYAAVIQKLQGELGVGITPFPELKNLVVDFISQNKELAEWASEEELSGDAILDLLLKGDNEFARKIRNEASMTIKNGGEQE